MTDSLEQSSLGARAGEPDDRRRRPRWPVIAFSVLGVAVGLALVAWNITLPYFAFYAGPVGDVLESVEVEGTPIYEPDGELYWLTVAYHEVNGYEFLAAFLDPSVDLYPVSAFRAPDETPEEYQERSLASMDTSKLTAVNIALDRLGIEAQTVGDGVLIAQLVDGTPAASVLEVGDIVTEISGEPVEIAGDVSEIIAGHGVGDVVPMKLQRGSETLVVNVVLVEHVTETGRPMVGISVVTHNPRIGGPGFEVDIHSSNTGGPSAGMMYTLGIIEVLAAEDLTAGHVIAGTGAINPDGTVGGIGGVRQKVIAAEAAGAEYILVPRSNYEAAITAPYRTIQIVPVETIDEVIDFVESLTAA